MTSIDHVPAYLGRPRAPLVACNSIADVGERKTCAGESAYLPPLGADTQTYPRLKRREQPYYDPRNSRYEKRMLDGLVDVRHGCEDGEEQRG